MHKLDEAKLAAYVAGLTVDHNLASGSYRATVDRYGIGCTTYSSPAECRRFVAARISALWRYSGTNHPHNIARRAKLIEDFAEEEVPIEQK